MESRALNLGHREYKNVIIIIIIIGFVEYTSLSISCLKSEYKMKYKQKLEKQKHVTSYLPILFNT